MTSFAIESLYWTGKEDICFNIISTASVENFILYVINAQIAQAEMIQKFLQQFHFPSELSVREPPPNEMTKDAQNGAL